MKRYTLLLALSIFSISASAQSEESALLATINNYLDGGTNGNVEQFKSAFLPDAVQRSIGSTGKLIGMSVENLATKIKPGQKMDRQTRIVSWSYSGIAATATTETVYATSKIIDYLNLVKLGNEWKITTRVYSRIESDDDIVSSAGETSAAPSSPKANKKPSAPAKTKGKVVLDDGW